MLDLPWCTQKVLLPIPPPVLSQEAEVLCDQSAPSSPSNDLSLGLVQGFPANALFQDPEQINLINKKKKDPSVKFCGSVTTSAQCFSVGSKCFEKRLQNSACLLTTSFQWGIRNTSESRSVQDRVSQKHHKHKLIVVHWWQLFYFTSRS